MTGSLLIDRIIKRTVDGFSHYEARVREDGANEWEWREMSAEEAEPIISKLEADVSELADFIHRS